MHTRLILLAAAIAAASPAALAQQHGMTGHGGTMSMSGEHRLGDLMVGPAWARASARMARAGAAFVTIRNAGATPDRLVAAATPVASRAELHTHMMENNVMRMRKVDSVPVGANATTELKPGGFHVMLMGLKAPLKEGDTFPLTLTFEKAGAVTVEVAIQGIAARGMGGMGGMGHHGHN